MMLHLIVDVVSPGVRHCSAALVAAVGDARVVDRLALLEQLDDAVDSWHGLPPSQLSPCRAAMRSRRACCFAESRRPRLTRLAMSLRKRASQSPRASAWS